MNDRKLRVVIIISPDIQDRYIASYIVDNFDVVGIFIEPQYTSLTIARKFSKLFKVIGESIGNPAALINRISDSVYYSRYKKEVKALFENSFNKGNVIDSYEGCPVYHTGYRDVSSPENVTFLKALKPDIIAACGCSILKENLLAVPPLGTINLHSGLAPYYRGCSCYFWPLYNEEPEYVGVTIHYVNPGIDDGNIIHQGRPDIQENDDENTIFVKMMELGGKLMIKSLGEIEAGTVIGHKQKDKGKLYLDNMTTVGHFRELHEKLGKGLIREYLDKQSRNDLNPNIIE